MTRPGAQMVVWRERERKRERAPGARVKAVWLGGESVGEVE